MLAEGRPAQPTASWGPWVAVAGNSGQGDLPSALDYHWGPPKSAPSRQPSPSAWRKKKGRGQEGELREGGGEEGRRETAGNLQRKTDSVDQGWSPCTDLPGDVPSPPKPRSPPSVQRDRQKRSRAGRSVLGRPWGGGGGSCCWGRETLNPSLL